MVDDEKEETDENLTGPTVMPTQSPTPPSSPSPTEASTDTTNITTTDMVDEEKEETEESVEVIDGDVLPGVGDVKDGKTSPPQQAMKNDYNVLAPVEENQINKTRLAINNKSSVSDTTTNVVVDDDDGGNTTTIINPSNKTMVGSKQKAQKLITGALVVRSIAWTSYGLLLMTALIVISSLTYYYCQKKTLARKNRKNDVELK